VLGYFTGIRSRIYGVPILGSPYRGWLTAHMGFNLAPGVPRSEALRALGDLAFNQLGCLQLEIGDTRFMLHDEYPEMGSKSPKTLGGSPMSLMIYSEDVDAAFAKATGAKATPILQPEEMFWGDRYGAVLDSSGFMWGISTHVEDVTPEEMEARLKEYMAKKQAQS